MQQQERTPLAVLVSALSEQGTLVASPVGIPAHNGQTDDRSRAKMLTYEHRQVFILQES